ncbi:TonB-dependent receptor [Chryseolinea sp. T2]|uniref:TonB-dependent receptor plug domain-containing protein n=1 Tax=Chryseolinea sp. T2 TaxID=3129255 RepID=UPI003076FF07
MKARFLLLSTIIPCYAFSQEVNRDSVKTTILSELVVTASRHQESLLQAPASVEKMNQQFIRQSPQPSFFDAITNLKGVQVITPSLGFKVINARGFAHTTNVRFVQMVDGIDNQAPHIGAPIGNSLGPNDLDILSVELIPGSASAMYGMNAINGVANFSTKDPFLYQGIAISQKTGVNNINSPDSKSTVFSETNLRIAKAFNDKWAFKVNGSFVKGTDWVANNRTDLNPSANSSTGLTGESNPGADVVNQYGDESSNRRTLTLGGKQYVVSRTGYAEKEVADYGLQNMKGDATIAFRPNSKVEMFYTYRAAYQNNIYQRTNRFRFEDYLTQQHAFSLKSNTIQFKAYVTQENTGQSYNIRSMAENVDRSFKPDNVWFSDFSKQFNSDVTGGMSVPDAMAHARAMTDNGRIQPGSQAMTDKIEELRDINNWDVGAALRVKAALIHSEFQHDITDLLFKKSNSFQLMYGVDYRDYNIVPDGNYFVNPEEEGKNINYWKAGGFVQATKLMWDGKFKANAVMRLEKNQYFDPKLNARLAMVYTPAPTHTIRLSAQSGYRFPSIFEAFSNINSGGRKRIGGLRVMSDGVFENSYTQSSITQFQRAVQSDVNTKGMTLNNAIVQEQGLLAENPYTYLEPERVRSLEAGYRAVMLDNRLTIDVDAYYNIYDNLIAQIDANVPKTEKPDSIPFYLQQNSKQNLYRLWTNSKTISHNYGATAGVNYALTRKLTVGGNFTYAKLGHKDQSDGLEDGFNTPPWIYNLSVSGSSLYKFFGFGINYREQAEFLWQSALATGTVSRYRTLDLQVTADLLKGSLIAKLGATNVLNQYYYSFIGGPAIGGLYYLNLTYALHGK